MIRCHEGCGLCCERAGHFGYMKQYDRGDGICKYLTADKKCAVYEDRPEVCNTDKLYEKFFASKMSREEYDKMNAEACNALRISRNKKP